MAFCLQAVEGGKFAGKVPCRETFGAFLGLKQTIKENIIPNLSPIFHWIWCSFVQTFWCILQCKHLLPTHSSILFWKVLLWKFWPDISEDASYLVYMQVSCANIVLPNRKRRTLFRDNCFRRENSLSSAPNSVGSAKKNSVSTIWHTKKDRLQGTH